MKPLAQHQEVTYSSLYQSLNTENLNKAALALIIELTNRLEVQQEERDYLEQQILYHRKEVQHLRKVLNTLNQF